MKNKSFSTFFQLITTEGKFLNTTFLCYQRLLLILSLNRFKADPAGTHWYHAHQGSMRGDGLAGPLIVLPRQERTDLPRVEDDFIIVIQEWNRNKSSLENHEIHAWNMHLYVFFSWFSVEKTEWKVN